MQNKGCDLVLQMHKRIWDLCVISHVILMICLALSSSIWANACDFQQCGMCDQQRLRSACAYAQSDQSLCLSLEYFMSVKLLTEHLLEVLSIKWGCTCLSESTLFKMPHCWKSCVTAQYEHSLSWPLSLKDKSMYFCTTDQDFHLFYPYERNLSCIPLINLREG